MKDDETTRKALALFGAQPIQTQRNMAVLFAKTTLNALDGTALAQPAAALITVLEQYMADDDRPSYETLLTSITTFAQQMRRWWAAYEAGPITPNSAVNAAAQMCAAQSVQSAGLAVFSDDADVITHLTQILQSGSAVIVTQHERPAILEHAVHILSHN